MPFTVCRVGIDGYLFYNGISHITGKFSEIFQSYNPDIGGVIPGVGELVIFWSTPNEEKLQSNRVVTEVWKTDDNSPAYPGE